MSNYPFRYGKTESPTLFDRLNSTAARSFGVGALVAGSLTLASCSHEEAQVPVFPVTGSVKFGTEVPVGAQVVLHPQGHTLPPNLIPTGSVGSDGTFEIDSYAKGDGAPAGEYRATLQWFKIVGGGNGGGAGRGPNVLPASYGDPTKSPVTVSVKSAANDLPPITIKR